MSTASLENMVNHIKKKTDMLMAQVKPEEPLMPAAISINGKYSAKKETFMQPGWTYSFFLANVAYMYICFNDEKYLEYLKKCRGVYTDFLFHNQEEIGHDTGFLYSLYAVAMFKITGEDIYRQLALKAADEVAKRIRFKPEHIQSFFDLRKRGMQDEISMMIVDDMMNMLLIMWAYGETGHSFYRDVYESHIATAVRYLIRDDYSVCHAFNFEVSSGNPICEMNYCGFSIGSHWARGTSWMIYGLTKALEFTGIKERYLPPLIGVAEKYLQCVGSDPIPVWDFRLPENAVNHSKDTSAAAITASAFLQLLKLDIQIPLRESAGKYVDDVETELCSGKWLGNDEQEFILDYGYGEGCSWGDYFFTELIMKKYLKDRFVDFWL